LTREDFEKLRGAPIEVVGSAEAEACRETSDAARLCVHPLVSVHMFAYNHAQYIREAVHGVMRQVTDFDFELIIGEDCSTDDTRAICFELQQEYPERIRVLWSDKNVNVIRNDARILARCRGAFIAYCEGDDYWTDERKLQKQVDALRQYPDVGLCFCKAKLVEEGTGAEKIWDRNSHIPAGLIKGADFFKWYTFGRAIDAPGEDVEFLMTATLMVRKEIFLKQRAAHEIFGWGLYLLDATWILSMASVADFYYIPDIVSHYRVNPGGVCSRHTMAVCRDAQIVRLYWVYANGVKPECPMGFLYGRLFSNRLRSVLDEHPERRVAEAKAIRACPEFSQVSGTYRRFVILNSKWWIPTRLMLKTVKVLSLLRRRLFSDMSK